MLKKIFNAVRMLHHGVDSISLYQKRDYYQYIPKNAGESALKRWQNIGERLYKAADKVVKHGG